MLLRRIHRRFARWLPRDLKSLGLLLVWGASLFVPVFHFDPQEDASSPAHQSVGYASCAHDCSGHFLPVTAGITLRAACPSGPDCANPWHHHHSDSRHDVSQCPVCSSLLTRLAELPTSTWLAPRRVEFIAPRAPSLPTTAERLVIALARGPPTESSVG